MTCNRRRRGAEPARSKQAMKSGAEMKALLGLLAGLAVALGGGCAAGPNYHTPKPDTPPAFVASAAANRPRHDAARRVRAGSCHVVARARRSGIELAG